MSKSIRRDSIKKQIKSIYFSNRTKNINSVVDWSENGGGAAIIDQCLGMTVTASVSSGVRIRGLDCDEVAKTGLETIGYVAGVGSRKAKSRTGLSIVSVLCQNERRDDMVTPSLHEGVDGTTIYEEIRMSV